MSVPKGKRNLSEMEFYHNALKIRNEMTTYLLKDFGIKSHLNKMRSKNIPTEEVSKWMIRRFRKDIYNLTSELLKEINIANSIYPTNLMECDLRRNHQDECIGLCHALKDKLYYIGNTLNIDYNKYMKYIELLDTEIRLLKRWRRYTNSMREKFI